MIIVRVELHSAITGRVTEIARMDIANIGGTKTRGDYHGYVMRGRGAAHLARRSVLRSAVVDDHPRLAQHVWHLVAKMLAAMGYGR